MPGKRCSISTCNNSCVKTGNTVSYHSFPRNKNVRDIWVKKCRRGAKWNATNGAVCSIHFKKDDYERDLKAELLNLPRKPKLKPTAIPNLNLNSSTNKSFSGTSNQKVKASSGNQNPQATNGSSDQEIKSFESVEQENAISEPIKQETEIFELDQEIETSEFDSHEIKFFNVDDDIKIEELDIGDNEFAVEVFHDLADENTLYASSASELQFVNASTQTETQTECDLLPQNERYFQKIIKLENALHASQNIITGLRGKITALEYDLHKAKAISKENSNQLERLQEGIGNILTQSQTDYGVFKKKDVTWTPDDISKAFTIRYFNSRCYMYLRDTLKYPLPDITSLQRWVSKINLKEGILCDVFRILKIAGYAITDFEKTVVLHIGETQVRSLYEYDEIQDEIVGPHSTMQVIMARGLFSDWKQPIYIGFDTKITEEVLLEVIEQLHEITYNVVACTSNCTKTNIELWKELAINTQETFLLHPITNNKIYFFVDSSYLLVLLHKWFTTTGFVLEDGVKITKEPLQQLIISETNSCSGLTQKHLEVDKVERQNIELASQVFSQSCVMDLKDFDFGHRAGIFIEKISLWFDVMNGNLSSKKPYGCDLELQNQILDSVYDTIKTMRCTTKNNMLIFQKGMLISINSLRHLFNYMKKVHSANHILTSRLNLDSLEDMLSGIRGSKNIIPSTLETIFKIRNLLLGDNISQGNISESDVLKNEYILTKVLTANISISTPQLMIDDSNSGSCSTEQDLLNYLPAWVATKYKDKYPELGIENSEETNYVLPPWVHNSSFKNLIKPSEKCLRQTELMNEIFISCHNENVFEKKENVTQNLIDIVINQYGNMIPQEVISDFIIHRILVRIRYYNMKLKLEVASSKRKAVNKNGELLNKTRKM